MKSEAKANQDMQSWAEAQAYEKARWAAALAVPVARVQAQKQKQGFFSRFFKVA
jgi:hypothetical protein